ncbi:Transcriptional regulator, TetR/AcrR family [Candidatus Desulfosporosinus infrequens]|uniref:Transcriptional regulator, TetR/AcrR family n=1 Tax=Candidatus Desulfosporosinus infrequens TaxID=2043169 RepID=A0A2U3LJA1_9FIRM|nr:Transcriptional regulator, TetR/AcrR family [Candidatus Desulfosporosinus infrequens]
MSTKYIPDGQRSPTFTEVARRAQIITCTIETIATLGYAQASLEQIAKRAGIRKGLITYYFKSREALIEQVVTEISTAGTHFMVPQIIAESTATGRLQAYLRSNIAYIAAHRMPMAALIDIVLSVRTKDGRLRYLHRSEKTDMEGLEAILRQGQNKGEFRAFDLHAMAVTIRGAIDAVGRFLVVHPNLDGEAYAQELVTLFDRATRKE